MAQERRSLRERFPTLFADEDPLVEDSVAGVEAEPEPAGDPRDLSARFPTLFRQEPELPEEPAASEEVPAPAAPQPEDPPLGGRPLIPDTRGMGQAPQFNPVTIGSGLIRGVGGVAAKAIDALPEGVKRLMVNPSPVPAGVAANEQVQRAAEATPEIARQAVAGVAEAMRSEEPIEEQALDLVGRAAAGARESAQQAVNESPVVPAIAEALANPEQTNAALDAVVERLDDIGISVGKQYASDVFETVTNPAKAFTERPIFAIFDLIDVATLGLASAGTIVNTVAAGSDAVRSIARSADEAADAVRVGHMSLQQAREQLAASAGRMVMEEVAKQKRAPQVVDETAAAVAKSIRRSLGDTPEARRALEQAGDAVVQADAALQSPLNRTTPVERAEERFRRALQPEETPGRPQQQGATPRAEPEPGVPEGTGDRPVGGGTGDDAALGDEPRFEDTFDADGSVVQQGVIPGAPQRQVPRRPIEADQEVPREGLFAPQEQGRQTRIDETPEPDTSFDFGANTDEAIEAVRAADEAGDVDVPDVQLSKGQLRAMIGGKTKPNKKLVEQGLVDEVTGRVTQRGEIAVRENVRFQLMKQEGVTAADADDVMELVDEIDGLLTGPEFESLEQTIDFERNVRDTDFSISKEFLARGGRSTADVESLPFAIKRRLNKEGAVSVNDIDDVFDNFLAGRGDDAVQATRRSFDEKEILDILEGPGPDVRRRNFLEDAIQEFGILTTSDEAADLAFEFRRGKDTVYRKLLDNRKTGAHEKGFRERIVEMARTRRRLKGEPGDGPLLSDEDIRHMFAGLPLAGTNNRRYERASLAFLNAVAAVGDRTPGALRLLDGTQERFLGFAFPTPTKSGAQAVRRTLRKTFGQDEAFIRRMQQFKEKTTGYEAVLRQHFVNLTKGYSDAEQKRLAQILRGGITTRDDLREVAQPVRQLLDKLGEEAAGLGLLKEETFFRNQGIYLPRLYREKEFVGLARRAGIDDELVRKLVQAKDDQAVQRIFSSLPNNHKLRVGHQRFQARRDSYYLRVVAHPTVVREAKRLDRVDGLVRQPEIPSAGLRQTAEPTSATRARAAKRLRRLTRGRQGQKSLGDLEEGLSAGQVELHFKTAEARELYMRRLGLDENDVLEMADPLPFEVRDAMGEIKEAGYLVYRGGLDLAYDVETTKLFRAIADNPQWSKPIVGNEPPPSGFVKVLESPHERPYDPIKHLRGRWVREEIVDDVNALSGLRTTARQTSDALVRWFKFSKVVANPATHGRNLLSNAMLANLGGMPFRRGVIHYSGALRDLMAHSEGLVARGAKKAGIVSGETSQYFQESLENGLLSSTIFENEMRLMAHAWMNSYGPDLPSKMSGYGAKLYEIIENASPRELAQIGGRELVLGMRRGADKIGQIYQAEEQLAKLALYRWARIEKGMEVSEAIEHAKKWIFDYGDLPPFIHALRSAPLGAPFVTFTFKALPRIVETSIDNPMRIGKWMAFHRAMELMAAQRYGQFSDTEPTDPMATLDTLVRGPEAQRNIKEVLRESERGTLLPLSSQGRQLSADWRYIAPWGDFMNLGGFALSAPFRVASGEETVGQVAAEGAGIASEFVTEKLGTPWWALVNLTRNRDPFTNREIYSEDDAPLDRYVKMANYIYSYMGPALAPAPDAVVGTTELRGGYSYERLMDFVQGATESDTGKLKQPSLIRVLMDIGAGVRLREIDPEMRRMYEVARRVGVIDHYLDVQRDAMIQLQNNEITQGEFDAKVDSANEFILAFEEQARRLQGLEFGDPIPAEQ